MVGAAKDNTNKEQEAVVQQITMSSGCFWHKDIITFKSSSMTR